jgi:hypothetical protein
MDDLDVPLGYLAFGDRPERAAARELSAPGSPGDVDQIAVRLRRPLNGHDRHAIGPLGAKEVDAG